MKLMLQASIGILLAHILVAGGFVSAQPKPKAGERPDDRRARLMMQSVEGFVEEGDWAEALKYVLTYWIVRKEDRSVEVERPGPDGKPMTVVVNVRAETIRFLSLVPEKAFEAEERQRGPDANVLFDEALKQKDNASFADVATRYPFTRSGTKAAEILAFSYHDSGDHRQAAHYFDRLLIWPGAAKLTSLSLYKAALSLNRAGYKGRAEEAWKHLASRMGKEELLVGKRLLTLDALRKEFEKE